MTNEERAKEFVKDFAEVYDPFDYMSGAAHEGTVIRLVELLTQVRNETIEEAVKVASQHESTDGQCPESIANAEGYRTAVSQIAKAIEALKDGAK